MNFLVFCNRKDIIKLTNYTPMPCKSKKPKR